MANDAHQQLLETLMNSSGNLDSTPLLEEMLSQLGDMNPMVKLLIQRMFQQQSHPAEEQEDTLKESTLMTTAEPKSSFDEAQLDFKKKKRANQRLRKIMEDMYLELEELRDRNDRLAEALGACYLCWGEVADCEICRGKGCPGYKPINKKLFKQFVIPVLRKLRVKTSVLTTTEETKNG